ncbi:hypothetical protein ACSX1A_19815 [Pontibacter sp. MBLB2868]|uniref:hypothetical protein n=1 Tax=Pontibacter sp. MBLB2868 TaxID=3451555 RepID=UPI003F74B06D
MRSILLLGAMGVLLLAGCDKSVPADTESTQGTPAAAHVLAQQSKLHAFSDPVKSDTFKIKLIGDSVQTATATLEIVSSEGELLYSDNFEANYLINYDLIDNATEAQKQEFILKRIKTFFSDENFKSPAIADNMPFDPNYSDEEAWNTIKSDDKAIGFFYLLGKEDGRWLAYSHLKQKVVLYLNCC